MAAIMKTLRILKVTKTRVTRGTHNLALPCFAAGVGLANAAVCAGSWHPFHGPMAVFGFAVSLLLAGVALAGKGPERKAERNRMKMAGGGRMARWAATTCKGRKSRPARVCASRFAPR